MAAAEETVGHAFIMNIDPDELREVLVAYGLPYAVVLLGAMASNPHLRRDLLRRDLLRSTPPRRLTRRVCRGGVGAALLRGDGLAARSAAMPRRADGRGDVALHQEALGQRGLGAGG